MSDFVLKTFARHMAATNGSILPNEDEAGYLLPEGALSLAASAVSSLCRNYSPVSFVNR